MLEIKVKKANVCKIYYDNIKVRNEVIKMSMFLITFDILGSKHYDISYLEIVEGLTMNGDVNELATSTTLLFEPNRYVNADQVSDFIKKSVSDKKAKVFVNVVKLIGEKGIDYSLEFAE